MHVEQIGRGHPGELTEADQAFLVEEPPPDVSFKPGPSDYSAIPDHVGHSPRREIATLVVVITFVLDRVAGGALEDFGSNLVVFVRRRVSKLMREKRRQTEEVVDDYGARPPTWTLNVEAVDEARASGFSATITASTPEAMVEAVAVLQDVAARRSTAAPSEGVDRLIVDETADGLVTSEFVTSSHSSSDPE